MSSTRASRAVPFCLALLAAGVGTTYAQTPAAPSSALPPGLIRQGNVIMMQPIADTDDGFSPQPSFGGEHRPGLVRYLSAFDHDLYTRVLDAAARGDWTVARGLASQGHDAIANKIIEWRYLLDKNSGALFADISTFLKDNPDWPDRDVLLARAENAIDPMMDPHAVVSWFGDRAPVTGIGKVRLGEALSEVGSAIRGRDLIREGWIEGSFDPQQEFGIIQRDGAVLTPEVDHQRLTYLLLRGDVGGARHEISRLNADDQRLAAAAIALKTSPSAGERMLDELPASTQNDPIILLDRSKLLRQRNEVYAIPDLLVRTPTREMAKINPGHWWNEINLDARDALALGDARGAYALAADTGLESSTTEYSDAQFLAGWIALRWLREPRTALTHFRNLAEAVTRPISKARAHYWEGRAYEAEGEIAEAAQQYRIAADSPDTFYGQVALARIESRPQLRLTDVSVDTSGLRAAYDREELTRAIHVLGDLGVENTLRAFAVHDADLYPDARHLKLLAEDLTTMGFREVALRVAKEASYNGVQLLSYLHPVISVPAYTGLGIPPEPALVLGIVRQETEFDPDAVSGAGARGIMQLMPSSARHDAQVAGIDYRPQALTGDATYSMQLGMAELSGYLSDWGGSYILSAAAYNAGPGNVRKWIAQFGDPRDSRTDPIDWIEEIPFSETRNYVQRVIENMEVYRNRLSGRDEPLRILADIYRPNAPQIGPLASTPILPMGATPAPKPTAVVVEPTKLSPMRPASPLAFPTAINAVPGIEPPGGEGITPQIKPSPN
jgi:soluble lytic murein transglycosylase